MVIPIPNHATSTSLEVRIDETITVNAPYFPARWRRRDHPPLVRHLPNYDCSLL